jgi:CrcB protein
MNFIWIGLFGLLGVFCRYGINLYFYKMGWTQFPWHTLSINVLGSLLIAILYVISTEKQIINESIAIGLIVGFLGGFTTFSAYSLETFRLFDSGMITQALVYAIASPIGGILAAFIGIVLTRKVF